MKKVITLLFFSILVLRANAQQAIFKQNSTSFSFANPANACKTKKATFQFTYLNDWPEFGNAFTSTLIGGNLKLKRNWNIDLNYFNDQKGEFNKINELYLGIGKKIKLSRFYLDLGFSTTYQNRQHLIDPVLVQKGATAGAKSGNNIEFNGGFNLGYQSGANKDSLLYYKLDLGVSLLNFLEPDIAMIVPGSSPSASKLVTSGKTQFNFFLKNRILKTQVYGFAIIDKVSNYITGGVENELLLKSKQLQSILLDVNLVNDGGIGLGIGGGFYGIKVKLSKGISVFNLNNRITNEYYQLVISYSI